MMRILLILLAVVIAVLAFVLDQPWLYWTAGALLVAALGALGAYFWRQYQEAIRFREQKSAPRQEALSDFGIVDVRPRASQPQSRERATASEAASRSSSSTSSSTASSEEAAQEAEGPPPDAPKTDATVLRPVLQALRTAVGAHTAVLLVQEEMALEYRIEALSSTDPSVTTSGSFTTSEPLLTARMSRDNVTVRVVGSAGIPPSLLGYYEVPPSALAHVALAPVPRTSQPVSYFLAVDTTADNLEAPRIANTIARFAELVGFLLEARYAEESAPASSSEEAAAASDVPLEDEPAPEPPADEEEPAASSPRPRREIIAEEIDRAQQTRTPLALALVHLNRAEMLSEEGADVVAEAEQALHEQLIRRAPDSRVERFGELTYGLFYRGTLEDVEPWAEQLQEAMAEAGGRLAGGVSIGVALLRTAEPQSPQQLREDATEALWVAYETGTCTIVE